MTSSIKFKLSFIFWLSYCTTIYGGTASGLLFKTKEELIDHRTSLDLYDGKYQKVDNSFSVNFDISIWDIKTFGYIFRLVNEEQEEVSLVFVNFRGKDQLYFDFNSNITNRSLHIPVSEEALKTGNWLPVRIHFNLLKNEAEISLGGKVHKFENVGVKNPDHFRFLFGLYGINLDVASMALRNITILKQGSKAELFPLDESSGNVVHNSQGEAKGYVKNPIWLINKHFEWEVYSETTAASVAGVTYNEKANKILIINPDSEREFDTKTKTMSEFKPWKIPFRIISGEAIYSSTNFFCYVYTLEDSLVRSPSLAMVDLSVSPPHISLRNPPSTNRLHHHNVFLSDNGEDLYIFGGYGKFTYSNAVYKYNKLDDCWDSIAFAGDTIDPRFFSASGRGFNPDEILIYGGFGNQSGKQELGGRNFYDLYLINLKSRIIKKMWEHKTMDETFVPCGNLILSPEKTHFYTLCYPHHISKTELKLYKFRIKDGSYEIVSNGIPFLSEKIESQAYLFYDGFLQKFFAVTREFLNKDESKIRIYSLYSPPVNLADQRKTHAGVSLGVTLLLILISLLIGAGIGYAIYLRRKNKKEQQPLSRIEVEPAPEYPKDKMIFGIEKPLSIKKNAIYVLGDFAAFDKSGKDITYRFSAKLKSLFALILLNCTNEKSGITTEKLTMDLWPERELAEAKNIRGVTIYHLREILNDMDGIELVYNCSKWVFVFENCFFCDYLKTQEIIDEMLSGSPAISLTQDLVRLTKRGSLFWNIQAEWIDDYKQKYESGVEEILRELMLINFDQKNYHVVTDISDAFFVIDPLNEEVLITAIRSLKQTGKIEHSQHLYNRFTSRYKSLMGKDYPVNYTSI